MCKKNVSDLTDEERDFLVDEMYKFDLLREGVEKADFKNKKIDNSKIKVKKRDTSDETISDIQGSLFSEYYSGTEVQEYFIDKETSELETVSIVLNRWEITEENISNIKKFITLIL